MNKKEQFNFECDTNLNTYKASFYLETKIINRSSIYSSQLFNDIFQILKKDIVDDYNIEISPKTTSSGNVYYSFYHKFKEFGLSKKCLYMDFNFTNFVNGNPSSLVMNKIKEDKVFNVFFLKNKNELSPIEKITVDILYENNNNKNGKTDGNEKEKNMIIIQVIMDDEWEVKEKDEDNDDFLRTLIKSLTIQLFLKIKQYIEKHY